jgi:hypothetical protein
MNLKVNPSGIVNAYEEAVAYNAYSVNYKNRTVKASESVLVRNNYLEIPTHDTIKLFAMRLTTAERTIDVNINAQKTPVLVLCDEKNRTTLTNIYAQYDGYAPVIFGDKSLDPNAIKVFKTDAPFIADKTMLYKQQIWNEAMTTLGINNVGIMKRERLNTDESMSNNQQISMSASRDLVSRQEACEKFNELFKPKTPASVKMREFSDNELTLIEGTEVENNG